MNEQHSGRPTGPERRAEPRLPSELKVYCCPVGGLLTERRHVRLRNISCRGVALVTDRPWGPATMLNLELPLGERPPLGTVARRVGRGRGVPRPGVAPPPPRRGGGFGAGAVFEPSPGEEHGAALTAGRPAPPASR